ncbi:hypothetical protein [Shinella sp. JR1-6]|uniref:hypothetical protein n=1 Tax=Shinella sp. JR1-6 TaxID=2527671 RepID=UPI00102D51D9|nr:hypothetical protein [Shinella sp. JR1-6]TAA49608.1 hypothetical protein EXZ48_34095 [Shinella sp. JR1-6]
MPKTELPPIYVMRSGDSLVGEMEADREWIRQQPHDQRIKVALSTGRSLSKLRFYWSFLGKVVKATQCAPSTETLHDVVKLHTGFVTPVMVKGFTVAVPKSISFSSMTEREFNTFLESAIEWIAATYGITPETAFGEEAA